MRNYKEDAHINQHDLENEWIEQPSLYLHYAEAHADAIHERDLKKSRADLVYAKLYSDFKKNWEKHFDSKPTEGALKESVIQHPDYRNAERAVIEAAKNANIMLAAKTSMDHRRRALENLVSLRVSGFHSEPSVNRVKRDMRQIEKRKYRKRKPTQKNKKETQ